MVLTNRPTRPSQLAGALSQKQAARERIEYTQDTRKGISESGQFSAYPMNYGTRGVSARSRHMGTRVPGNSETRHCSRCIQRRCCSQPPNGPVKTRGRIVGSCSRARPFSNFLSIRLCCFFSSRVAFLCAHPLGHAELLHAPLCPCSGFPHMPAAFLSNNEEAENLTLTESCLYGSM